VKKEAIVAQDGKKYIAYFEYNRPGQGWLTSLISFEVEDFLLNADGEMRIFGYSSKKPRYELFLRDGKNNLYNIDSIKAAASYSYNWRIKEENIFKENIEVLKNSSEKLFLKEDFYNAVPLEDWEECGVFTPFFEMNFTDDYKWGYMGTVNGKVRPMADMYNGYDLFKVVNIYDGNEEWYIVPNGKMLPAPIVYSYDPTNHLFEVVCREGEMIR